MAQESSAPRPIKLEADLPPPETNALPAALPSDLAPEMKSMVRGLAVRLYGRLPQGCGVDVGDLIQAGNVGLLKATKTFQSCVGAPLLGYAKFRIRGEMLDLVRRHIGRETAGDHPGSSRSYVPGSSGGEDWDASLPASADSSPQSPLFFQERTKIIQEELKRLPARYRAVVRLRYAGEFTLRQIGAALNVNESRACQLHQKALVRLKTALRSRGVSDFSQL
ncbi:MAG TPA: sigma-70 family RNA polymerase sigma factor [Bryobacteraceae bacterium]|nr:sigma-70 family RNA polymerase sigma factor [Bryobacteraceae bacterium]